ncbi:MAG: hypothetical protein JRE18_12465 [Deltaproteobacteria bacterium]|jgi:oligoendopeptidase F|nr:hypothetical protein [Deltaproteobacteria bacterium]
MSNVEEAIRELCFDVVRDVIEDEINSIDWGEACSEGLGLDPVSVEQAIELVEQHEDTLSDLQELMSNLNDASELQEQVQILKSTIENLESAYEDLATEFAANSLLLASLLEKPVRFPRLRKLLSRLVFWK